MFTEHIRRRLLLLWFAFTFAFLSLCKDFLICCGLISLFLVGDFLQPVELLTVELVEFGVDVYYVLVCRRKRWSSVHLIVFSVRGMITCSMALTESLVNVVHITRRDAYLVC